MEDKATLLFDNALEKLKEASEELFKPEEDVVSYLVCKNSQYAIENFLKGFLLQNGIQPTDSETLDSLYEKCKDLNEGFKNVKLSDFNCKSGPIDASYCNDVAKVSSCYEIANNLDTFLRQEKYLK